MLKIWHVWNLYWLVPWVCQHHQNATLSQRQAVAVSQNLSAMTAVGLHLTACNSSSPYNSQRRWMSFFEQILCFSLTWWTHIIAVILSHSVPSLILLFFSCVSSSATCLIFFLFFVKLSFFLTPPLCCAWCMTCISPWLPGATWMQRDKWICQERKAGETKVRKWPICRANL